MSTSTLRVLARTLLCAGFGATLLVAAGSARSVVFIDTLTLESDSGIGGYTPYPIIRGNPLPDPYLQARSLSMRNFSVLMLGCLGETCSGFVPTQGSVSFVFEVTGPARLENASFTAIAASPATHVPAVDVYFRGSTETFGSNGFSGRNGPGNAQAAVTQFGTFDQRGGTLDISGRDFKFVNVGTYVLHGEAEITVGRVLPSQSGNPEPGLWNRGLLRAEHMSPNPMIVRSVVERIDNHGTVQVASPNLRLELGGGVHRSGVFEILGAAGSSSAIEYSGAHVLEGTTVFKGADHVLLGKVDGGPLVGAVFQGRGPGPARMTVVGGAEAVLDQGVMTIGGDGNSGEGAMLAMTGDLFTSVPGGSFTVRGSSTVTVQPGGHVAVGTRAAPVGRLSVDGALALDVPSSVLEGSGYEDSGIANYGTTTVGGRVEGPGTLRSYGRLEVAAGGLLDVGTLRVLDGTLSVDGTVRIGDPFATVPRTGRIGIETLDPTPVRVSGSGLVEVEANGELILMRSFVDAAASPSPGTGPLEVRVNSGGTLRVAPFATVDVAQGAAKFHVASGGTAVVSDRLVLRGTGASTPALVNEGTLVVGSARIPGVLNLPPGILEAGDLIENRGTLSIEVGGRVFAAGGIDSSGRLEVNGLLDTSSTLGSPGLLNVTGTLCGNGQIKGPVVVAAGGSVSPGCSVGTLQIEGGFTLDAGAELVLEIERSADGTSLVSDQLLLTGPTFPFLNGLVRFRLGEGVDGVRDLAAIRSLTILQCAAPAVGCGFGPIHAVVDGYLDPVILLNGRNGFEIVSMGVPIPEPATFGLYALGLGVLGAARRMRQSRS